MSKIVGLFLKIVVLGVLAKSLEKTEKGVCFFSKARSCRPYSLFKGLTDFFKCMFYEFC